jgi:hypothetical protein
MNDGTGDELDEAVAAFRDAAEEHKVTGKNLERVRAMYEQSQAEHSEALQAMNMAEEKLQTVIRRMR